MLAFKRGTGVMAEIDDVLSELRHRITGPFESGPPKPARSQHPETNEGGLAMPQSVNTEYQRHGSAAVALRRLAHPGRDSVIVDDAQVSGPINPDRNGGVVVGDDPLSPLIRRLSTDMPQLMEEVVAFIERRAAELNGRDDGLLRAASTAQDDDAGKTAITLLFDTRVLARIDADARRVGISRVAWLHIAADERLGRQ
jgi:hypothetical protein